MIYWERSQRLQEPSGIEDNLIIPVTATMSKGTGTLSVVDPDLDLLSHKNLGFSRGHAGNVGLHLVDAETVDVGILTCNAAHLIAVHQTVGMICALGLRRGN